MWLRVRVRIGVTVSVTVRIRVWVRANMHNAARKWTKKIPKITSNLSMCGG